MKMKKIFVQIEIISFLIFMGTALASSSYREYEGTGSFLIKSNLGDVEEQAEGNAEGYSGSQYITDEECQGYDICSKDISNIFNGNVDLEQTITDNYNGESSITTYNTGLSGTGTAYSALFSSSNGGYGYQHSSATGDTYAYFTQNHKENGNFDYEASYGGGTLGCDDGSTLMQNSYSLMNSPTYYSPIELTPNCTGEGCNFVYLSGNATDVLSLSASLDTRTMSWYNGIDLKGSGFYDVYGISDEPIKFDFEMVLG
jgi:hypothetical protein